MILMGNIMGDPHSPLIKAEKREKGEITLRNSFILQVGRIGNGEKNLNL